jgi:hypothetical protein
MDETNDSAGVGHNLPPDPDGERGLEAIRDYDTSIAKEKTSRDAAIAAAARYGDALIAGRARCKTNCAGRDVVAQPEALGGCGGRYDIEQRVDVGVGPALLRIEGVGLDRGKLGL